MKIQKGIVKYKDRSDIVCTYGITDDGKQYYFLDENDEKRFANGNRIASTALVEAIDPMVKASNIGVIDENGNVVIPFENRSIRPISNDLVLVELANPVSSSVIDAVKLKSDPLAATKLVSTPALIKDKLNKKMGSEARYIFNDQFSEATICDINGNNLINNQYFSFIGMDSVNKKLYFSKNTPDSDIVEYSVLPPEVQSNIAGDNKGTSIDLGSVNVNQNVVEDALNGITFGEEPVKEDTPVQKVPTNQVFEGSVIENNVEQEQVSEVPQSDIETVTTPNSLIEGVPFDSSVSEKMVNNGEDINNVVLPFDEKKEETEVSEDSNVILPFDEKKEETGVSEDSYSVILPFEDKKEEDTKTSEDNKVVLPFDEKKEEVEVPFSNDSINNEVVSSEIVNQMINSSDNAIDLSDNNDKQEEEEVAVEEAKEEHEEDADTKKDDLPIDINDIVIPTVYEDEETASREEVVDNKKEDSAIVKTEEQAKEEVSQESEVETEENSTDEDTNPKVEEVSQETEVKVDDAASADVEDEKEEVVDNKEEDSAIEETEDVNMEYDSKEVDLPVVDEEDDEEIFKDSVVRTDKIIDEDEDDIDFDTDDYKEESDYGETDNTMGDFVKSFSQLVNQNKEQRKELVMKDANIVKLKQRLAKVNNNRKEMLDDLQILRQNNESLSSKLRMSKDTISDLENTKKKLEGKIRSLEKAYEQMAREAETLRAKVSRNNGDMAKLLADAKDVLKGTGSKDIDFDYDDDSYLRRVA